MPLWLMSENTSCGNIITIPVVPRVCKHATEQAFAEEKQIYKSHCVWGDGVGTERGRRMNPILSVKPSLSSCIHLCYLGDAAV